MSFLLIKKSKNKLGKAHPTYHHGCLQLWYHKPRAREFVADLAKSSWVFDLAEQEPVYVHVVLEIMTTELTAQTTRINTDRLVVWCQLVPPRVMVPLASRVWVELAN